MKWVQVGLSIRAGDEEDVVAILREFHGVETLEIADKSLMDDLEEHQQWWNDIDPEVVENLPENPVIRIYLPQEEAEEKIESIKRDLKGRLLEPPNLQTVDEEDWANEWKKYYEPTPIGEHLVIVPSWEHYEPKAGESVITLDPGMAFGTGTHETTALCGAALERYVKPGDTVFDIGTGSGILALIAAKLGATNVVGVDIDPLAVKVAKENAVLNGVEGVCRFVEGDLYHVLEGQADLIVSNIIAEIISPMVASLQDFLVPGGILILSGIISSKVEMVKDELEAASYELVEMKRDGEWVAMVAKRC